MGSLKKAVLDTALITPSGALSPGPLSASAIAAGIGLGSIGGLLVAMGHLIVEVPYFILLLVLMSVVEDKLGKIKPALDIFASGFIILFSYLLADTGLSILQGNDVASSTIITNPATALVNGIALTGANAYFLAWWFTVGKPIIDYARKLGWRNAGIIYLVHYTYDLVWLVLLATLGGFAVYSGARLVALLMFSLAAILLYFAYRLVSPYMKPKVNISNIYPDNTPHS